MKPDEIVGRLRANLKRTADLVGYGLASHNVASDEVRLPGSLLQFGTGSAEAIAPAFGPWLLTVGLRRYIEVFNEFLIDVGAMSELYRVQLTPPCAFDVRKAAAKFRRMGFPEKLDVIERNIDEKIPKHVRLDIESINKARARFEHDRGLALPGKGGFELSFRGVELKLSDDGGDRAGGDPPDLHPRRCLAGGLRAASGTALSAGR